MKPFLLSLLFLGASVQPAHAGTHPVLGKPSAPLSVDYQISGKLEIGQTANVQINTHSAVPSKDLTLETFSKNGIQILSERVFSHPQALTEGEIWSVPIQVQILQNGTHYLHVKLTGFFDDGSGFKKKSKVLSIKLQIGKIKTSPARAEGNLKPGQGSSQNVIEIPVESKP